MLIKKSIVVFAAAFITAAFFLQTAGSKPVQSPKKDQKVKKVKKAEGPKEKVFISLPAGVKWGQRPKVVRLICPDLQSWEAKGIFWNSLQCAQDFSSKKFVGNAFKMSYKFSESAQFRKGLSVIEFHESHQNAKVHAERVAHFVKLYTQKFGEPVGNICTGKGKEKACLQYFWRDKQTSLMVHVVNIPDRQAYGIYFLWQAI